VQFLKDYAAIDIFVTEFMAVRTFNNVAAPSSSMGSIPTTGLLLNFEGFVKALNSLATIKNPDPHLELHVRQDKFMQRIFFVHRDMLLKASKGGANFLHRTAMQIADRNGNGTTQRAAATLMWRLEKRKRASLSIGDGNDETTKNS